MLGNGPVLAAYDCGHVEPAVDGLLDDELSGLAVGGDDCDVLGHDVLL